MPDEPARGLALDIVERHLELLASRDYTRSRNITGAGEEALRAAQRLIQALNPRPGAAYAKVETRYVIPDVIVRKQRSVWRASLNPDAMPRLRINRLYAELAAGARNSGAAIASQLQEARWLIKKRAAALRHHPARIAGDRRPAAPFPRARRSRDAAAGAARDCADARAP